MHAIGSPASPSTHPPTGPSSRVLDPRGPSTARLAWRAALLTLDVWVFSSSPAWFGRFATTPNGRFLPGTLLLAAITAVLAATWGRPHAPQGREARAGEDPWIGTRGARDTWARWAGGLGAAVVAVMAAWLLFRAGREWLGIVLTTELDPASGDMLPAVRESLADFVRGEDPYAIHHVPWPVPLPYGPVLWLPYLVPFLLRADLRLVSVFGQLFVPAACLLVATAAAARRRWGRVAVLAAIAAAILSNGELRRFTAVAHTPSYWPLLVPFCLFVAGRRHVAAAVVLGLLVAGRTTMVAVVPVLLITVWHRDRPAFLKAAVALVAAAGIPFLPFALWDPGALHYGMVASYLKVMKEVVWPSADGGVLKTFGLTGFLLSHGRSAWVEPSQAVALALVVAAAWQPLRRGASPLPWAGLALLAFSMTALWPVYYVYFDVFLLFACAILADDDLRPLVSPGRGVARFVGVTAAVVVVIGALAAGAAHPDYYGIDIGSDRPRWRMAGFARPESQGDRRYCWVIGQKATVLLGRTTRRRAVVRIDCRPFLPSAASRQTLRLVVNGVRLEQVPLARDWGSVAVAVPPAAWQVGLNRVDLFFGYAASPRDAGLSEDDRPLAAAVSRVAIEPAGAPR